MVKVQVVAMLFVEEVATEVDDDVEGNLSIGATKLRLSGIWSWSKFQRLRMRRISTTR